MGPRAILRIDICFTSGANPEAHPVIWRWSIVIDFRRGKFEARFMAFEEVFELGFQLCALFGEQDVHN